MRMSCTHQLLSNMQPVLFKTVMYRELQDGDIVNVDVSVYYKVGQSIQCILSANRGIAVLFTIRCG
jgi:hypothetical protein